MPKEWFRVFQATAPLMFTNKKNWYIDPNHMGWEIFEPALERFNEKRRALMLCILLMLDELMSGWRPKTSKCGGLPNISFEPRKPVPLGTQLKNGVKCLSSMFVFQDIVQVAEVQQQKEFLFDDYEEGIPAMSSMPSNPEMAAHVAEVLRQVKGAGVPDGRWCGGDAWFGSVMSCVELRMRLGVFSTFIVKSNHQMYPKAALHKVLTARPWEETCWTLGCDDCNDCRGEGDCCGLCLSTCGNTETCDIMYESKYEDDYGLVCINMIPRPNMLHFYYEYAPLIDEHNKQQQSILGLERRWLTKNCWFQLIMTSVGMSVFDMHRLYHYHEIKRRHKPQEVVDQIQMVRRLETVGI